MRKYGSDFFVSPNVFSHSLLFILLFRFSCKDPLVNVNENDLLKFICPDKDISSKPNAHSSTLYEVAYLLDYTKEQEYENCDARGIDLF